ncbi:Alpha/beta fold hydrolase [Pararobbsia alpina]|uniref:alpha/beta fold hydrolase n=1 Tax=Pararobbsia alpina TaxID=621374 RepID=UPI0039A6F921
MSIHTSLTAPNRYVDVAGTTYAYRRFGTPEKLPVLCLQHFTGTLDNWDPAIVDALASDREVILFDNAGVGRSTGKVPDSIVEMARHVEQFLDAIELAKVNVLGFSLGGFLAQELAIARPERIERLVISGSAPEGGEGAGMDRPELLSIYTDESIDPYGKLERLFFPPDDNGQRAAKAFVARLKSRTGEADAPISAEVAPTQLQAMMDWANRSGDAACKLNQIPHKVLVTNGSNDVMIPTRNSMVLAESLPNATLIVYPNSGHGALFQYPSTYVGHVRQFLDEA